MYDLGCGDGRILRAVSRRHQARAVGFEVNLMAYLRARIKCLFYPDVKVVWGDFRKADLKEADLVFCYLFPDVMRTTAKKLTQDLKPGTRVISCNFPFPDWKPIQLIRPRPERHSDPIYVYQVPARPE